MSERPDPDDDAEPDEPSTGGLSAGDAFHRSREEAAWAKAGVPHDDVASWRRWRIDPADARAWRAAGVTDGLTAAQWETARVTPRTVRDWVAEGIGPTEAVRWHEFGFGLDGAKAERLLGYQPTCRFQEGLERAIEWYVASLGPARPALGRVHRRAPRPVDRRVLLLRGRVLRPDRGSPSARERDYRSRSSTRNRTYGLLAQPAEGLPGPGLCLPGECLLRGWGPLSAARPCVRSNGGCQSSRSSAMRCTPSWWRPPPTRPTSWPRFSSPF
mgnify:CR=1 FL=1